MRTSIIYIQKVDATTIQLMVNEGLTGIYIENYQTTESPNIIKLTIQYSLSQDLFDLGKQVAKYNA